jgi:hypothetical protein
MDEERLFSLNSSVTKISFGVLQAKSNTKQPLIPYVKYCFIPPASMLRIEYKIETISVAVP